MGRGARQGIVLGSFLAAVGVARALMWGAGIKVRGGVERRWSYGRQGCVVVSMLPLAFAPLGFDPATSSTPFIASLATSRDHHLFQHCPNSPRRIDSSAAVIHP